MPVALVFEVVVAGTQRLEVGLDGVVAVVRDDVVQFAGDRGPVAAREPAGPVALHDLVAQRGAGFVAERVGDRDRPMLDRPGGGAGCGPAEDQVTQRVGAAFADQPTVTPTPVSDSSGGRS